MQREWNLHYPSWIIGDGEPDRDVGDAFDWFAVDFWGESQLVTASKGIASAIAGHDYQYHIVAEVTYLSENSCVIDFGLHATGSRDSLPPQCVQGDYVSGEVKLELPLCIPTMPESVVATLKHRWHVDRISADTTPYVAQPDSPRFFKRDESQIRYEDVTSTESVNAEMYVLHCSEVSA